MPRENMQLMVLTGGQVDLYSNAGDSHDLSGPVMDRYVCMLDSFLCACLAFSHGCAMVWSVLWTSAAWRQRACVARSAMFHSDNAYRVPAMFVRGHLCKTHTVRVWV